MLALSKTLVSPLFLASQSTTFDEKCQFLWLAMRSNSTFNAREMVIIFPTVTEVDQDEHPNFIIYSFKREELHMGNQEDNVNMRNVMKFEPAYNMLAKVVTGTYRVSDRRFPSMKVALEKRGEAWAWVQKSGFAGLAPYRAARAHRRIYEGNAWPSRSRCVWTRNQGREQHCGASEPPPIANETVQQRTSRERELEQFLSEEHPFDERALFHLYTV